MHDIGWPELGATRQLVKVPATEATYPVTGVPRVREGSHDTVTELFPGTTLVMVGLVGAPAGVEEEDALGCPVPAALSAATTTT